MVVKIMYYIDIKGVFIPSCDSCGKKAYLKIFTEKNREYVVGIRLCKKCYKELVNFGT